MRRAAARLRGPEDAHRGLATAAPTGSNGGMLHLHSKTPTEWGPQMAPHIDAVLLDHAHLEKKAASTALTLLFRHPQFEWLQRPLSELAREELSHFEAVLGHLERRGVAFGVQKPAPYAGRLLTAVRTCEPDRLLDTLLCCALIEARSCERMGRLAEALPDPTLAGLYRGLLVSEAHHHVLYLDLARRLVGAEVAEARLGALAAHEAQVIAEAPPLARLHSAAPPASATASATASETA